MAAPTFHRIFSDNYCNQAIQIQAGRLPLLYWIIERMKKMSEYGAWPSYTSMQRDEVDAKGEEEKEGGTPDDT